MSLARNSCNSKNSAMVALIFDFFEMFYRSIKINCHEKYFNSFLHFTGSKVLVVKSGDIVYRGTIAGLPTFHSHPRRPAEYIWFEHSGSGKTELLPIWIARDDVIADPPEWNPTGKPIELHQDILENDIDDSVYHAFLCEYCDMYTRDLFRHIRNEHGTIYSST